MDERKNIILVVMNWDVHVFILQSVIKKKYGQDATNVGDEGGFAPNIQVLIGYL